MIELAVQVTTLGQTSPRFYCVLTGTNWCSFTRRLTLRQRTRLAFSRKPLDVVVRWQPLETESEVL